PHGIRGPEQTPKEGARTGTGRPWAPKETIGKILGPGLRPLSDLERKGGDVPYPGQCLRTVCTCGPTSVRIGGDQLSGTGDRPGKTKADRQCPYQGQGADPGRLE